MKKLALLGLALAVSLGLASASFAAFSEMTIHVTVQEAGAGIELLFGEDYYFGDIRVGGTKIDGNNDQTRIFRNNGDTTSTWQMQMSEWMDGGGNTPVAESRWRYLDDTADPDALPGRNQIRLSALWQLSGDDIRPRPVAANFRAEDTLTTTEKRCSATDYGAAGIPDDEKGFNIPASGERQLHLMLQAPATGSNNLGIPMRSLLTVTAL